MTKNNALEHLHEVYDWIDGAGEIGLLRTLRGVELANYCRESGELGLEIGITALDVEMLADWLRKQSPKRTIQGPFNTANETLCMPTEIQIYRESAIACHPESGDVAYETLEDLKIAYQMEGA